MSDSIIATRMKNLGRLEIKRADTLDLLEARFPGQATPDVVQTIQDQDSMDLLHDWFLTIACANEYEDFRAHLRRRPSQRPGA